MAAPAGRLPLRPLVNDAVSPSGRQPKQPPTANLTAYETKHGFVAPSFRYVLAC